MDNADVKINRITHYADGFLESFDQPWKTRSSTVQDPSGNQIDLFQG